LVLAPKLKAIGISHKIVSLSTKDVTHNFKEGGSGIINYEENRIYTIQRFGSGSDHFKIIAWNADTLEKISEYPSFESRSIVNKISPDGKFVAVGRTKDAQEETRIIDAQTALVKRKMQNAKDEIPDVDRIVFSPDGKQVALVSKNVVNVYDISDLTSTAKTGEGLN
jgi:WD40 repeat protein